jgi:hypothetical protein
MTTTDLVKHTRLSAVELNNIVCGAGHTPRDMDEPVHDDVVVRAIIADVFIGCYPERRLEILTAMQMLDLEGDLGRGITAFVAALDAVQGGEAKTMEMPPLMLSVTDSRYMWFMTAAGITKEVYDLQAGALTSRTECLWPWMSMVIHVGTLMVRDRTYMQQWPNVALGDYKTGKPTLERLDHPVRADTELPA